LQPKSNVSENKVRYPDYGSPRIKALLLE